MAYIPYVVEQSNHGERSYDIFSRLLNDRIILLHDQVNSATASVVVAQLLYLEGQDPDKDIYLYINSPGGSVSDGMAIYDSGLSGQVTDIMIHSNYLQRTKERLNRILSENTGKDYETICRDTERDNFMSADEALEYGLIDKVYRNRADIK